MGEDLQKYESVQQWLKHLKPSYKKVTMQLFPKWVEHVAMNPDQLVEARRQDLKSDDMAIKRRFERLAKDWYYDLINKDGKSETNAYNHLKSVMSFFAHHYMKLQYARGEIKRQTKKRLKTSEIAIEDLKSAYVHIESFRDKAIFSTLIQTGLSIVDVCKLNIEDIIKDIDNPPIYVEGYRSKTEVGFQTCVGEDSAIAIKKYLNARGNPTKGALFISRTKSRMTSRFVSEALEPQVRQHVPNFKVKMLRDVYHDALKRAKIDRDVSDRMFGHQPLGARKDYLFSEATIKEAYTQAYPYLSLDSYTRDRSKKATTNKMVLRLGMIIASENPRTELAKYIEELREEMQLEREVPTTEEGYGAPRAYAPEEEPTLREQPTLAQNWFYVASKYLESA